MKGPYLENLGKKNHVSGKAFLLFVKFFAQFDFKF